MDAKVLENYTEYGGCVDIDEVEEEEAYLLIEHLQNSHRVTKERFCSQNVEDGFAFAIDPHGHLVFISSIITNIKTIIPSLTFKERIERRGYSNVLPLDMENLLRFAKQEIANAIK